MSLHLLWRDARRLAPLAWPVFVGQVSVLAFATVDTVLLARATPADLAALAIGGTVFIAIFIGLMGVSMALAPIAGQLHGAGRAGEAGRQVHQAVWLAVAMSVPGCALLAFPGLLLGLAQAAPDVEDKARGYLLALAFSLPASLLFTVFRAFSTAVSRPRAVMNLQLAGLAVKVPLSAALAFGLPALGVPALGVVGCGIATAVSMWSQAAAARALLRRDPFYAPFDLLGRGLDRPDRAALGQQLRLGVPMGLGIMVEVTGFSFMSLFISRLGTTPVAGHQLAANLVSLLFMMPLALAHATSTLVAQRIGAGDGADARRLGGHGLLIGCTLAAAVGAGVYLSRESVLRLYTGNDAVIAAAMPLLAWVAVFHVADAAQTVCAYVLRAYKIATVPTLIYVAALWGVGLGGGYLLAFDLPGGVPGSLQGAPGFWFASTAGLALSGVALAGFMAWVLRRGPPAAAPPAG